MIYNLDKKYFSNGKVDLSDAITPSDWRKLRRVHIKDVITYEDESGTVLYQCSACGKFSKTVDLHDHWEYDTGVIRRLDSFENLCFMCHALRHVERLINLDGSHKVKTYRGFETGDLLTHMYDKYQSLTNRNFYDDLKVLLENTRSKIKVLEESKELITNDYALLRLMNQALWSADPIHLGST